MRPFSNPGPALFLLGLLVRLPGLFVNGIADMEEMIFHMGSRVLKMGLAHGLAESYGPFSYALFGLEARAAFEVLPFWWLPYKVVVLLADIALYVALRHVVEASRRRQVLWLYWLNPFFVLSGVWLGFWDTPHVLCALLATAAITGSKRGAASWFAAGLILAAGAMLKPQGLFFFPFPLLVYSALTFMVEGNRRPFAVLTCGLLTLFILVTAYFVTQGAPLFSLPLNYRTVVHSMPNLCNECLNVWRPVTRLLQFALGQEGPTIDLRLPRIPDLAAQGGANLFVIAGVVLYTWRRYAGAREGAFLPTEPMRNRITASFKWLGVGTIALASLGALRTSDLAKHSHPVLGRYSSEYAAFLAAGFFAGTFILAAAPLLTRAVLRLDGSKIIRGTTGSGPPSNRVVLLLSLFAFTSLAVSQIGTRAHENHSYAALVLLVPLVARDRRLLLPWVVMVVVLLYGYLSSFQLGRSVLLPTRSYPAAADLLQAISESATSPALLPGTGLLEPANRMVKYVFRGEPWVSLLCAFQFLFVLTILRRLWLGGGRRSPA